MKILVTGGAGFIGSHLATRLLRDRHQVAIIDDLNDFYPPHWKLRNLEVVRQAGEARLLTADICDQQAVTSWLRQDPPEAIIHLAARAGVRPSLEQPLLYERVNVQGTMVLLEACRELGVRKFVFASSSSIYGIANQVPFREDDNVNLPISPYAATKIAGEKITYTYAHLYGLRVVCLRFFTVFGPRQRPDLAIRKFLGKIERGEAVPFFGDGSAGRDYTYVDDTVSGIIGALNYDCHWDVFNLGNSHPVTLTAMVEVLEAALGKKAKLERLGVQPGDVPITWADISKARTHLAYDPMTPFAKGVERMVAWHRENSLPL